MMKYLALMFAVLVGAISCVYAQATRSAAASQAWVENYVSNAIAKSAAAVQAGTTVVRSSDGVVATANAGKENEMRIVVQAFSDAALAVTNCSDAAKTAGISDGALFVWNGSGSYINPKGIIKATSTNFVFSGVKSIVDNDNIVIPGWFGVKGVLIQPSESFSITNGMTEVVR